MTAEGCGGLGGDAKDERLDPVADPDRSECVYDAAADEAAPELDPAVDGVVGAELDQVPDGVGRIVQVAAGDEPSVVTDSGDRSYVAAQCEDRGDRVGCGVDAGDRVRYEPRDPDRCLADADPPGAG
jgi:hypothetical protein